MVVIVNADIIFLIRKIHEHKRHKTQRRTGAKRTNPLEHGGQLGKIASP